MSLSFSGNVTPLNSLDFGLVNQTKQEMSRAVIEMLREM
jgi:hypothetical protein